MNLSETSHLKALIASLELRIVRLEKLLAAETQKTLTLKKPAVVQQ